jgi:hypothetical protein
MDALLVIRSETKDEVCVPDGLLPNFPSPEPATERVTHIVLRKDEGKKGWLELAAKGGWMAQVIWLSLTKGSR